MSSTGNTTTNPYTSLSGKPALNHLGCSFTGLSKPQIAPAPSTPPSVSTTPLSAVVYSNIVKTFWTFFAGGDITPSLLSAIVQHTCQYWDIVTNRHRQLQKHSLVPLSYNRKQEATDQPSGCVMVTHPNGGRKNGADIRYRKAGQIWEAKTPSDKSWNPLPLSPLSSEQEVIEHIFERWDSNTGSSLPLSDFNTPLNS
jgi:hypothetical protein